MKKCKKNHGFFQKDLHLYQFQKKCFRFTADYTKIRLQTATI